MVLRPDSSALPTVPDLSCETELNESACGCSGQPTPAACPWLQRITYLTNYPLCLSQLFRPEIHTRAWPHSSDLTVRPKSTKLCLLLNSSDVTFRPGLYTCTETSFNKTFRWIQSLHPSARWQLFSLSPGDPGPPTCTSPECSGVV